jgi:hypothetical protein
MMENGAWDWWSSPKVCTDPRWKDVHRTNALSLVMAAALAYESSKTIKFQLRRWNFEHTKVRVFDYIRASAQNQQLNALDTQGFVAANGHVR